MQRLILITAATIAVFVQGCGCDSKTRYIAPNTGPDPDPETETISLSGIVNKGIVIGGIVNAHPIINGVIDLATSLGSATTNNAGGYTVNVDATITNSPFVVRVTAAETGTQMKCDLPAGCDGGVTFGSLMDLAADSGFSLDAVIPDASDNAVANITLLTDIATDLAVDAIGSGATSQEVSDAIVSANSRVANRFGIIGDLVTFPTIDLTNQAAVATATSAGNTAAINYATLNAAIVEAVRQDDGTKTVAEAISSFANSFVTAGLAGNTSDDTQTDLSEIFAAAQTIISRVEAADQSGNLDLVSLDTQFGNQQQLAANEPADSFDQGTVSPTAGDTDLEKVKAMVAVLRDIGGAIGGTAVGTSNDTIQSVADSFSLQLSSAEMATSDTVDEVFDALLIATEAIVEAAEAYEDNNVLTTHVSGDGVSVAIVASSSVPTYSINGDITFMHDGQDVTAAVAMMATDSTTYTKQIDGSTTTYTSGGGYALSGTVENTNVVFTMADGSRVAVNTLAGSEMDGTSSSSAVVSADSLVFSLDVSLAQKETAQVADPITIEADISLTFTDIDAMEAETKGESSSGESTATLDLLSFALGGGVSNSSGESYRIAFSFTGETEGVTLTEMWDSNGETLTHETESNYAGAYASLVFTADLAGVSSAGQISLSAVRTALEDFTTSLTIAYPGVQLSLSNGVDGGELSGATTVVNQDGVTLTMSETQVDGETVLSGNITLDGTQYATIEEESAGVLFRYTDGTFESL